MPRARRSRHGTMVAVLVTALTVAGCSATSDAPDAAPSLPSSPSATPSPTVSGSVSPDVTAPSEPPVPEAPRSPSPRPGPKGQEAFARHVMASWVWALRHNDAAPLLEVSASRKRPCSGCASLDRELRRRDREGWYAALPGIDVERTRVRRDGEVVVATSRVDIPESDAFHEDGSYRSTSPAHADATFVVVMTPTPRRFVLESFTVR